MTNQSPQPSRFDSRSGHILRVLKDGYWARTDIVEMADGSRRVRKSFKGATAATGPWGVLSLRREIHYLTSLSDRAREVFPPVLDWWDDATGVVPQVGYDMPFYHQHTDAGSLARQTGLGQDEVDAFQNALAAALLDRVHEPVAAPAERLSVHVAAAVGQALDSLESEAALARLIGAERVTLNGERVLGPRAAFAQIMREPATIGALDAGPQVRLHGDFFLENILWRPSGVAAVEAAPPLILLDPVSVAGVSSGPPVFDLVKYESYATGELLALRSEWVEVGGFDETDDYRYRFRHEEPALEPFRSRNWHARFRRAFENKHGPLDRRLYRLIDGYFSLAMAVNTGGTQRRARLLKATQDFNAVLSVPR